MTETMRKRPGAGVTIDTARLARMRHELALSRQELAARMMGLDEYPPDEVRAAMAAAGEFTITPDAVAKIENGRRKPKAVTLRQLCAVLDCEPADLLPPMPPGTEICPDCLAQFGHEPGCPRAT